MTIKELLNITSDETIVLISYNGDAKRIDRNNAFELDAFGPYVIEKIAAAQENTLEAEIKIQPVRIN